VFFFINKAAREVDRDFAKTKENARTLNDLSIPVLVLHLRQT